MGLELLPVDIRDLYEVHEWKHACAILSQDFPAEWDDIIVVLRAFRLHKRQIAIGGGNKSQVSAAIDSEFYRLGWAERAFKTSIVVDEASIDAPTHNIDCFKNCVGLEVEWNNKDPFFDRDLNNFRLLFDLRAVSVGVIITRCDELQRIFDSLGRGSSYGESTTHMRKLLPKVAGGGSGGCLLLVFGISSKLYIDDEAENG